MLPFTARAVELAAQILGPDRTLQAIPRVISGGGAPDDVTIRCCHAHYEQEKPVSDSSWRSMAFALYRLSLSYGRRHRGRLGGEQGRILVL